MKEKLKITVAVILTSVICFSLSSAFYNGKLFVFPSSYGKMNAVFSLLDSKYYESYDKDKAIEKAIGAYVSSIGDPYTEYMGKSELKEFYTLVNSTYCGIGVTVQNNTEDNTILVINTFENSPAKEAGISEGDIITKVDGVAYSGEQLNEATEKILGAEGTDVVVTVLKKDTAKEVDLTITRRDIVVDSVSSEVLDENIGYIAISQFSSNTDVEFKEHLKQLELKNITGLIVDVRDNGGGITTAVENIADHLLPRGKVIYYTADKYGNKKYSYSKKDGCTLPLVVICNKNSASASEILIGAIKDNGRGVIVGEKSYGKGVVQQLMELGDDTALKVTIEKYFTPNGDYINKKGIEPDYKVELTENDTEDTQLKKAIELLK